MKKLQSLLIASTTTLLLIHVCIVVLKSLFMRGVPGDFEGYAMAPVILLWLLLLPADGLCAVASVFFGVSFLRKEETPLSSPQSLVALACLALIPFVFFLICTMVIFESGIGESLLMYPKLLKDLLPIG